MNSSIAQFKLICHVLTLRAVLEHKIRAQLGLGEQTRSKIGGSALAGWHPWAVAAGLIGLLLFGAMSLKLLRPTSETNLVAEQVVSNYVRVVEDLAPQGFPLAGGRLDYSDGHPVAALVYKRRRHTINLFLWPSDKSDTSSEKLTNKGFNIVHWNEGHMTYWAISDLNTVELNEFARDLKARSL